MHDRVLSLVCSSGQQHPRLCDLFWLDTSSASSVLILNIGDLKFLKLLHG